MQDQDRVVEISREYQTKVDLRLTQIQQLDDRIRTQEWYHELSEQESDNKIDQMLGEEPRSAQEA